MRWMALVVLGLGFAAFAAGAEPPPETPAPRETPWLGVIVDDAVDGGVLVIAVHPSGPADRAGLRGGDVLLRVDGREVSNRDGFVEDLVRRSAGSSLRVELLRRGAIVRQEVVLGSRGELVSSFVPLAPAAPDEPLVLAELPAARMLEVYGLSLADVTPDLREHLGAPPGSGVLVIRVDERAAAVTGLRVGDVLLALDDEPVDTTSDVETLLVARQAARAGSLPDMTATLVRGGERQKIAVELPRGAATLETRQRGESLREVALEEELRRLRSEAQRLARRIEALEDALATLREMPEP